jgi:hypothetical protein
MTLTNTSRVPSLNYQITDYNLNKFFYYIDTNLANLRRKVRALSIIGVSNAVDYLTTPADSKITNTNTIDVYKEKYRLLNRYVYYSFFAVSVDSTFRLTALLAPGLGFLPFITSGIVAAILQGYPWCVPQNIMEENFVKSSYLISFVNGTLICMGSNALLSYVFGPIIGFGLHVHYAKDLMCGFETRLTIALEQLLKVAPHDNFLRDLWNGTSQIAENKRKEIERLREELKNSKENLSTLPELPPCCSQRKDAIEADKTSSTYIKFEPSISSTRQPSNQTDEISQTKVEKYLSESSLYPELKI